jgi:hypothetical protein
VNIRQTCYTDCALDQLGAGSGGIVVHTENQLHGYHVAVKVSHSEKNEYGDVVHEIAIMRMLTTTPDLSMECARFYSIYILFLAYIRSIDTSVNFSVPLII